MVHGSQRESRRCRSRNGGQDRRVKNRQEVFQMITIIQGVPVMIGEGTGNISVIDVLDRK